MDDLIERLRAVVTNRPDSLGICTAWQRNPDGPEAADRIAALEAELERRKYDGIHTCSDACPRPACVLRRENAALEADNARLMGLVKEAGEALEPYAKQADKYDPEEEDGLDEAWSGGFLLMDLRRARATLAKIKEATDA